MADFRTPIAQMSLDELNGTDCDICFLPLFNNDPVEIVNGINQPGCHHRFHHNCLQHNCGSANIGNSLQNCQCPICRQHFDFTNHIIDLMPQVQARRQRIIVQAAAGVGRQRMAARSARQRMVEVGSQAAAQAAAVGRRMIQAASNAVFRRQIPLGAAAAARQRIQAAAGPEVSFGDVYCGQVIRRMTEKEARGPNHRGPENVQQMLIERKEEILSWFIGTKKHTHGANLPYHIKDINPPVISGLDIETLLQNPANYNCVLLLMNKYPHLGIRDINIHTERVMRELYDRLQRMRIPEIRDYIRLLQRGLDSISERAITEIRDRHIRANDFTHMFNFEFNPIYYFLRSIIPGAFIFNLIETNETLSKETGMWWQRRENYFIIIPIYRDYFTCAHTIIDNYLRERERDWVRQHGGKKSRKSKKSKTSRKSKKSRFLYI